MDLFKKSAIEHFSHAAFTTFTFSFILFKKDYYKFLIFNLLSEKVNAASEK